MVLQQPPFTAALSHDAFGNAPLRIRLTLFCLLVYVYYFRGSSLLIAVSLADREGAEPPHLFFNIHNDYGVVGEFKNYFRYRLRGHTVFESLRYKDMVNRCSSWKVCYRIILD